MSYLATEKQTALSAVTLASKLTEKIFRSLAGASTVSKDDKSPVTIADFGAQALVNAVLARDFPKDPIVGEEDSSVLQENAELKRKVWDLVRGVVEEGMPGLIKDEEEMCAMIDRGSYAGSDKGRMWALDPIDGTKGFLRGGQYAVCLALIKDGEVELGVIGCPNIPVDKTDGIEAEGVERGIIMHAIKGQGSFQRSLHSDSGDAQVTMRKISSTAEATFCESVESGHSAHTTQHSIATTLGITAPSVRMDSQSKYASIARGSGDIYLRLPVSATYEEKIWDHASGVVIVEEAGGKVTDMFGKRLDFGMGRTLRGNKGVIAAPVAVHGQVMEVVRGVMGDNIVAK